MVDDGRDALVSAGSTMSQTFVRQESIPALVRTRMLSREREDQIDDINYS